MLSFKTFLLEFEQNLISINLGSLSDYLNVFVKQQDGEYDYSPWANSYLKNTENNLNATKQFIESCLQKMPDYQNTPIIITPHFNEYSWNIGRQFSDDIINGRNGIDDANVSLNGADFTLFNHDGSFIVDDVLEAGDSEFFTSPEQTDDYFSLINEISGKGGTRGKIITLYTARPKKDRALYQNAETIPINIFLTNDLDHARGLGTDLGGERDVWKVRINTKSLTLTNDASFIKYYQVTKNNQPAEFTLIDGD
jgi:hypothetical protein